MCLHCLRLKKHIIFHISYIVVAPLCPAFLKCVDFYKAHRSEKRGALWLVKLNPVCCDWSITSNMWRKCYAPLSYLETPHLHDMVAAARIKVTPSFFAYTFGQCFANLPTQWRRHVGRVWTRRFRKIQTFVSLRVWDFSLCYFTDLIFTRSACNTPQRREWPHHMTVASSYTFGNKNIYVALF